ncbi:MAG: hypothetical protein LBS55_12750 [Prevotellaceae bacterium]|nr:hypothetical protein [Prevotellaceae bacterium]
MSGLGHTADDEEYKINFNHAGLHTGVKYSFGKPTGWCGVTPRKNSYYPFDVPIADLKKFFIFVPYSGNLLKSSDDGENF